MKQRSFNILIIAFAVLVLDYVSKIMLLNFVSTHDGFYPVFSNFNLVQVWNYGVSFGMFQLPSGWGPYVWSFLSIALVILLFIWALKSESKFIRFNIALIIGGAIGNVVDRIKYGAVADFFDFHIWGYHWPAFNIADIAISCGACLIIVSELFLSSTSVSKGNS